MWIVSLTKKPKEDVYKVGYFPRRVHYKKEAVDLVKEVVRRGGEANYEREK